jgi:hypothetical protein
MTHDNRHAKRHAKGSTAGFVHSAAALAVIHRITFPPARRYAERYDQWLTLGGEWPPVAFITWKRAKKIRHRLEALRRQDRDVTPAVVKLADCGCTATRTCAFHNFQKSKDYHRQIRGEPYVSKEKDKS